jgi:hypothetical protein
MTKRKKGHQPWDPHPTRPWLPDVPGHLRIKKAGGGVVVSKEIKEILVKRTKQIEKEILEQQAAAIERKG